MYQWGNENKDMKEKINFTKSVLYKQSFPRKVNLKILSRVLHRKYIKEEILKHKKIGFYKNCYHQKSFSKIISMGEHKKDLKIENLGFENNLFDTKQFQ